MLNKLGLIALIFSLMLLGCTSKIDDNNAPIVGCGDICEGSVNR